MMTSFPRPPHKVAAPNGKKRPLSPFWIYKPQITMTMSIWHRFTGIALCGGLSLFSIWLVCLALGTETTSFLHDLLKTWIGQFFLIGFSWSLFYHICNGIRHVLWDYVLLFDLPSIYKTGYGVLFASFLLTAALWLHVYGVWL